MKYWFISIFLAALFSFQDASAFSIGRDGEPYWEENIEWQPVSYKGKDAGFKVSFPGEPQTGLVNGDVFAHSQFKDVSYEIITSINRHYKAPRTERVFMQDVTNEFGEQAEILSIPSTQKKVKYIAELYMKEISRVARVYCTSNHLYWAIVTGDDLTFAPLFFDTIQITKGR